MRQVGAARVAGPSRHRPGPQSGSARSHIAEAGPSLLRLQKAAGNAAVHELLSSRAIQAKLRIGSTNDEYEQQADQVANEVMSSGSGRKCACGGTCAKCAGAGHAHHAPAGRRIMRLTGSSPSGAGLPDAPAAVDEVLKQPGAPLPEAQRARFGAFFGSDFKGVRVHADARAAESARAIDATAYTVGADIVFGAGQYAPGTSSGQRLLAHELTHVVQQSGISPPGGTAAATGNPTSPVVQRQQAGTLRTSPVNPNIPSEKWSTAAENAYRRAGLIEEANAVRACRELGVCDRLLTEREAWNAYQAGRLEANLGPPPESGPSGSAGSGMAMAGMAAPVLAPSTAPAAAPAAQTATARAAAARAAIAARWGGTVIQGGAASGMAATTSTAATTGAAVGTGTATTTATTTAAAAGTSTAAAVGTVAVPVVLGVVLVVAIVDLARWGRFQKALREQGYMILPAPLGVCIGLCHQAAPRPRAPMPFPDFPERLPPPDPNQIEEWLRRTNPNPQPQPRPQPIPTPVPQPVPQPRRRRRRACRPEPCEHPLPISWPTELPLPTVSLRLLVRTTAEEREWEGIDRGAEQRRFQEEIRRARERLVPPPNPCFEEFSEPNAPYDAHHAHPLYLGGEDAFYNLCSLRADMHQLGHPRLDNQTAHLDEYVECGICSGFLSQHPPGQAYIIVGSK